MEGGFITKLIIGGIMFSMFAVVLIGIMSFMGNQYNTTLESDYTTKQASLQQTGQSFRSSFNNATVTQLNEDFDSTAQDQAQFRGFISGEQQKTTSGNIFTTAVDQIYEVIPFDNNIKLAILSLITISLAVGLIYLFFKVVP
jgi:hypothetical protein